MISSRGNGKRIASVLVSVSVALALAWSAAAQEAESALEVYRVDKAVSEFAKAEDFSTPESAYAAINRIVARGSPADWKRVSVRAMAEQASDDTTKTTAPPDRVRRFLDAVIVEVRVYRKRLAVVLASLEIDAGRNAIDLRYLMLEEGRWLNRGQDSPVASLALGREIFGAKCNLFLPEAPEKLQVIEAPDEYLSTFVQFLDEHGDAPEAFVLRALREHAIVIMGEVHHRPRYWAFNSAVVRAPGFAQTTGVIYLELPMNGQPRIDRFLAADELDTTPVIETLRDMFEMGWPDEPMREFFMTVWYQNKTRPADEQVRIVLVDMPRRWERIETRADWRQFSYERDGLMSRNIIDDRARHPEDTRNGLFIVGVGHAMLGLTFPDTVTPRKSSAWHLRRRLGAESVYSIFPHMPVLTNTGRVYGRLARGLFDSAFAARNNAPIAFPLDTGPFGALTFDALPDWPRVKSNHYRHGYSAYLYLGPLETEIFSPLIPDFYTETHMREVDRRYRIMYTSPWHVLHNQEATDAESFIAWMSRSWGQPRRAWKTGLGSLDAWRGGE